MPANSKLIRDADIVMCIDCTGSMKHTLDIVKENALKLYDDLMVAMEEKGKTLDKVRVRVIAFRDYCESVTDGNPPMLSTPFFNLPEEKEKFAASVRGLQPVGGGDDPEDGLEALGFAMSSDWRRSEGSRKCRHIIALWTDDAPHWLSAEDIKKSSDPTSAKWWVDRSRVPGYPDKMAKNMEELTEWWGDGCMQKPKMPEQNQKRLVLYAPDAGGWKFISDNWKQVVHYTTELASGVQEYDYAAIINALESSI